jgi:hypothetical protein
LCVLLLAAGCDSSPEPLPTVRGKVSYKGVPLHTGTIVFTPNALRGSSGELARANLRPDGAYSLHTGDKLGAAAGWYRVTIAALEESSPASSDGPFVAPRSLLPEKYRDPELSGLGVEIKAGQENAIDFDLD